MENTSKVPTIASKNKFGSLKKFLKKETTPELPKIVSDKWGSITLLFNNEEKEFKDVIILPRGCQEWDWNWNIEKPMKHYPGIRVMDLIKYLENEYETFDHLILSTGR